jgi:hypothetical protein
VAFGALRAGEILDDVFHPADGRMELAHDVRDAHVGSCPEKPRAPTRCTSLRSVNKYCAWWHEIPRTNFMLAPLCRRFATTNLRCNLTKHAAIDTSAGTRDLPGRRVSI